MYLSRTLVLRFHTTHPIDRASPRGRSMNEIPADARRDERESLRLLHVSMTHTHTHNCQNTHLWYGLLKRCLSVMKGFHPFTISVGVCGFIVGSLLRGPRISVHAVWIRSGRPPLWQRGEGVGKGLLVSRLWGRWPALPVKRSSRSSAARPPLWQRGEGVGKGLLVRRLWGQ